MKNSSSRILTGIFSTWATFLLTAATSLIMAPFLVHHMGNAGYGLWSLYMAITGYFTLLDFGVSPAVVRYTSKFQALGDSRAERRILATGLAFFAAAALLVIALCLLGTLFYQDIFPASEIPIEVARATFLLVGLDFSFTLPFAVFQGLLLGHQRYLAMNGLNIGLRLGRFALVLLLLGEGAQGLVIVAGIFLCTGLIRDFGLWRFARGSLIGIQRSDISAEAARELLSYSLPAFVISVALRVMAYTDSMVIAYVLGVGMVTYYALAASLVDYVQEIGWGLAGVLVPVVSGHEAKGEQEQIRKRFLQFTRYCVWLMIPILVISRILGKSFYSQWVGPDYLLSADLMDLLMAAMVLYVVQLPAQAVLKGMSLHKRLAWFMGIEAILNLGLSLVLAQSMGVIGVALGTLIPRALFNGLLLPFYVLRRLRITVWSYLRQGFLPAVPGAAGTALVAWKIAPDPASSYGWASMVGVGLLCVGVFGLMTLTLGTDREERAWLWRRSSRVVARLGTLAGR